MATDVVTRASPEVAEELTVQPRIVDWRLLIGVLCVAALGLWWMLGREIVNLWNLWTGNGLASIGILIPPAAVCLALHSWSDRHWEWRGSWWGLPLCAVTLSLAYLAKNYGSPVLVWHEVSLRLFPVGLHVFLYVSGVVVLFAGFRYYRAALFPISLLLFLNPAPQFFTGMVDLPLQYVGAHTARSFAHWIGVPLAVDDLRIMFSPALGMFIAPGCNGMRGALAMAFLTMIVGHLYGLPWLPRALYVASGVVIAYLLNLLRLCGLVLCYRVALKYAPLARHMTAADYVLGSSIFFLAAIFIFAVPRKWKTFDQQPAGS